MLINLYISRPTYRFTPVVWQLLLNEYEYEYEESHYGTVRDAILTGEV